MILNCKEDLRPVGMEFELKHPAPITSTELRGKIHRYKVVDHRLCQVFGNLEWGEVVETIEVRDSPEANGIRWIQER